MRGSTTHPKKVEEAKAIYAETNNYAEVARELDMPRTTAFEIVKAGDDFEQLRTEIRLRFIKEAFEPLMMLVTLTNKKVKELSIADNLFLTSLRDLTGAMKDIKTSIENVGNTINVIGTQNNQITISTEDRQEAEILWKIGNSLLKKYNSLEEALNAINSQS